MCYYDYGQSPPFGIYINGFISPNKLDQNPKPYTKGSNLMFPVPQSGKKNNALCYTAEGDLDMVGTLREGLESGENPILVLQDLMRSEDDKIKLLSAGKLVDVMMKLGEKGVSGMTLQLVNLDMSGYDVEEMKGVVVDASRELLE
jgi:hypothetical protein